MISYSFSLFLNYLSFLTNTYSKKSLHFGEMFDGLVIARCGQFSFPTAQNSCEGGRKILKGVGNPGNKCNFLVEQVPFFGVKGTHRAQIGFTSVFMLFYA
jgi:hypothetical protein